MVVLKCRRLHILAHGNQTCMDATRHVRNHPVAIVRVRAVHQRDVGGCSGHLAKELRVRATGFLIA